MNRHARQEGIDPLDPFEVILQKPHARRSVVLRSARDPDRATLAFHLERERLRHEQVVGALLLIHHDEEARTLLWVPLEG